MAKLDRQYATSQCWKRTHDHSDAAQSYEACKPDIMVAVVLVDGQCVLCDGFAQLVARLDSRRAVFFAAQQSDLAQAALQAQVHSHTFRACLPDAIFALTSVKPSRTSFSYGHSSGQKQYTTAHSALPNLSLSSPS
jgi:hypothetical protein